jgi:hypothetical protein
MSQSLENPNFFRFLEPLIWYHPALPWVITRNKSGSEMELATFYGFFAY